MAYKFTDFLTFYRPVKKLRVAEMPENATRLFLCIGPGGKGSDYVSLSADQALELARYLTVEAHRAIKATEAKAKGETK